MTEEPAGVSCLWGTKFFVALKQKPSLVVLSAVLCTNKPLSDELRKTMAHFVTGKRCYRRCPRFHRVSHSAETWQKHPGCSWMAGRVD